MDASAFALPPSRNLGIPERFGNAPSYLPRTRTFARLNEDVSLIKRTALPFREGMNLEIRFDFINLFNRTRLGDPNPSVDDVNFGKIFEKVGAARPRNVQAGLQHQLLTPPWPGRPGRGSSR